MAERRIHHRQGRRDRFRGSEGGRGDQPTRAEIKRRSRSEGPTNRISLQHDDNGEDFVCGKKNEKIVGPIWAVTHSSTAARVCRPSPPVSDDGSLVQVQEILSKTECSDSDSNDSDAKVWTKNPLVVRKTRKSGKIEKRQSGSENGFSTGIPGKSNRDSLVYYDRNESGGSAKGNKYHKLEELRKKRIDIQMTSDEENTPESRISRLRQRAIQSGLGKQPRSDFFRPNEAALGSSNCNYSPKSPKTPGAFFPNSSLGKSGPQSSPTIRSSSFQSINGVPSSAYGSSCGTNQSPRRQTNIRPFDARGFSDSGITSRQNQTANGNRFSLHQDMKILPAKAMACSSSPEVSVRQSYGHPRVSSVDSVYESTGNQEPVSSGIGYGRKSISTFKNVGHGFVFMRPTNSGMMELPSGDVVEVPPKQFSQTPGNEVVELQLKARQGIDRSSGTNILNQQRKLRANIAANSDDSLDELVESNIHYLQSEIENGRVKKSMAPVSRSASLPDPKRSSGYFGTANLGPMHSGEFSASSDMSQPHIKAGSELKFHLSIPGNPVQSPSEITLADQNRKVNLEYSVNPPGPVHNSGVIIAEQNLQNYVVPECNLADDSRLCNHLSARDMSRNSFSKSDTQLNTAQSPFRENPKNYAFMKTNSNSDQLVSPGGLKCLNIPQFDRGMFSDVDYDIEVAERVNRWETYMKKKSDPELGIIRERNEDDLLPRNIRRSFYVEQKLEIPQSPVGSVSQSISWSNLQTLKPSSSDPTIHLSVDPHVIAQETNQVFQLIREPKSGTHFQTATSAVSTFYAPSPQRATGGLMSAAELRQQMMANKIAIDQSHRVPDLTEQGTRASRYQELDEIKGIKSDSVRDLCKRFDLELGGEAYDDNEIPSPSKQDTDTDWSKLISDLEDKIKETEVWSPNMESNQGDMVSIERVKARTLQTIPFSEDPFWKEIEEMTSFENMFNGTCLEDPIAYRQHQLDYSHNQCYTLPTQPKTTTKDRLHRSKSLYTPNITPLTISIDKYSTPSALDDVLDDIKTSLEKQQSPKIQKGGGSSESNHSSPKPSSISVNITSSTRPRICADATSRWDDPRAVHSSVQPAAIQPGLLMYASQPQVQQSSSMQEYPNVVNGNYQLDPNLLKQKLLNTGLAEDPKVKSSTGRIRPKLIPPVAIPQSPKPPVPLFPLTQPAPLKSQPIQHPSDLVSEDKINQVNQSMEDLRTLAKDVEDKISVIKSKLVTADEKNLDKILLALRKFAPAASPQHEPSPYSFHDFYTKKKSKLSDALTELERIYKELNLEDTSILDRTERRDYLLHRTRELENIAVTERPEQKIETTSISLQVNKQHEWDSQQPPQDQAADFDSISKSFQAILDEINQTSNVMAASKTSCNFSRPLGASNTSVQLSSPEPKINVSGPAVPQVLSSAYVVGQSASPEIARKPMVPERYVAQSVQPFVQSPQTTQKCKPAKIGPKVVNPSTVRTVTQEPLRNMTGNAAFSVLNKKPGLCEPERQVLQANVSKLMNQGKECNETKSHSVSIVLKSPTAAPSTNSQQSSVTSTSRTPPEVAPRERKSRGRFRSKNPYQGNDENKPRSKSTPRNDTTECSTSTASVNIKLNKPAQPWQTHNENDVNGILKCDNSDEQKSRTALSKMEFHLKKPKTLPEAKIEKSVVMKSEQDDSQPQSLPRQRTVETQTMEDPGKVVPDGTEDKKYGSGVARLVDIFNSSDEERNQKSRPLYTRSAPNLTLGFDVDDYQDGDKESERCQANMEHFDMYLSDNKQADKSLSRDQVLETSAPSSPSTKPPVHPFKKPATSADKSPACLGEKLIVKTRTKDKTTPEVEAVRGNAVAEKPDRPKSFHELLASFETISSHRQKLKSLRKFASEDYIGTEPVLQKTFLSEPYHSEPNLLEERGKAPSREEVRSWIV